MRKTMFIPALVLISALPFSACAQTPEKQVAQQVQTEAPAPQPIDLSAFDGYEEWPLIGLGEFASRNEKLADQRIVFDATFPGPDGLNGPQVKTTMVFDVLEVYFQGKPALWLQWSSTGRAGEKSGTGAIDYLIVDRETHRTLHRVQSLGGMTGPPSWMGPMAVINFPDKKIIKTLVNEDGTSKLDVLEDQVDGTIDFAALPFWLPFIELEKGMKFRVPYFRGQLNEVGGLPIYIKERKQIQDANGNPHMILNAQVMSPGGAALTEFWVSENAPYFMGWDFRLAKTGKPVSTMAYKKHWNLKR